MYQILLQMHFIWFKILKDFLKNFDTKIVNEKKKLIDIGMSIYVKYFFFFFI